jgi:hypothetical protein
MRAVAAAALDTIDRFGFLGQRLTLGHGVWLTDATASPRPALPSATNAARISGCAAGWRR